MNRTRRPDATKVGAWAIALIAGLTATFHPAFHALPLISPDSASYLNADVGRTALYPLLLRIVPLPVLPALQLAAVLATAAWLAIEMSWIVPATLGLALEAMVVGNPPLVAYAFTVLPEAFFVAAEQALFAVTLRLLRQPSRRAAAGTGTLVAVLIFLKPAGYSFVAVCVAVLWLERNRFRELAAAMLGPIAAMLFTASALTAVRSGAFGTQSYGGYAAIGYVAHLLDRQTPTAYPELAADIVRRTETSRREIEAIRPIELYYFASSSAYHDMLDAIRPTILGYVRTVEPGIDDRSAFVRMNQIAQSLTASAIKDKPRAYVRHASAHWYGLWFMPLVRNSADARHFAKQLEQLKTTAPYTLRNPIVYRRLPALAYWPFKLSLIAAFAASLVGLAFAIRAPMWTGAAPLAVAAIAVHANFLLVCAVQTGLPRYALAMWPGTMLLLILAVAGGLEAMRRIGQPGAASRGATRAAS